MKTVLIGLLGTVLDKRGKGVKRWNAWRPTVGICMQDDLLVDRIELLHDQRDERLAQTVEADIGTVSPQTQVRLHHIQFSDPWDFENVYSSLLDFVERYPFKPEEERYLVHITTGTHVAQICWFLLCEANYIPGVLLQTSPGRGDKSVAGNVQLIDLDLSKYDAISSRFKRQQLAGTAFLKSGIATRNAQFNAMIEQIERVAIRSTAPILITGPTGAGKSQLAKKIYELKHRRGLIQGEFVAVNCATLRGDSAMSTLFGHSRGAFTGAQTARKGLLAKAHQGLLLLDEIGELGQDEQAMLLKAIEEKRFLPFGGDSEVESDFQLIAGTVRDLRRWVQEGRFREDLFARINLWTYDLPGLAERTEDIEPNLDFELARHARDHGEQVRFNREARRAFLDFATSPAARWAGNFRELSASVTRMATLAVAGRIDLTGVQEEVGRLQAAWQVGGGEGRVDRLLGERVADFDLFDRMQLERVVAVCERSRTLSEAGRRLFDVSRQQKASNNDADRLRKYLARFGLDWQQIQR
ncbi:MAG: RNA repair transcriptional activator RtcR [Rhodocyclaceae bacterium]|nr:RNA repair transcriptional activator RtcR [Rhodocyclaceae bacterium]